MIPYRTIQFYKNLSFNHRQSHDTRCKWNFCSKFYWTIGMVSQSHKVSCRMRAFIEKRAHMKLCVSASFPLKYLVRLKINKFMLPSSIPLYANTYIHTHLVHTYITFLSSHFYTLQVWCTVIGVARKQLWVIYLMSTSMSKVSFIS